MAFIATAQTYNNGVWYSLYDESEHTMNTQGDYSTSVFAPTTGALTVKWKYNWLDWLGIAKKIDTDVLESANGGSSTNRIGSLAENTDNNSNTTESFTTSRNINWLKYNRSGLPTHKVIVYYQSLPLAKHILLKDGDYGKSTDEHDFGELYVDETSAAYTVQLRSFLSSDNITVTSSNPAIFRLGDAANTSETITYAVGANACASVNGSADASASHLGKIDKYNFAIYFVPAEDIYYEETITITDGTSTVTIAVTGQGALRPETEYAYEGAICEGTTYTDDNFVNLTEAGVYTKALVNAFGGDSVITFTLSVLPNYAFVERDTITEGDEVSWQGHDLSLLPAGEHTLSAAYQTASGCDSTYTLQLLVHANLEPSYAEYIAYICRGERVEYAGRSYSHNAQERIILAGQNAIGGDSIIDLMVIQLPSITIRQSQTVTKDTTITWQAQTIECLTIGTETHEVHYASALGCDSTYVLNLTIENKPVKPVNPDDDPDPIDALDEVVAPANDIVKVIYNGHVFIRKGEAWYDLYGRRVE